MGAMVQIMTNTPREDFENGLILGFARSGKTVEAPLRQLSLLASQRKFARINAAPKAASPFMRTETKPFMLAEARRQLIKLVSGKDGNSGDTMALRAVTAITDSGFSLHPFDFAKLEDFIARHAQDLGPDARQWLSMVQPEKKIEHDTYLEEAVNETNFAQASRPQRLQFLRDMRLRDPLQASQMLENVIAGEAAETRLKYLAILSTHLNETDKPFLEKLLNDRAPSVKELAGKLLARLPGSEAQQRRIAKLQDYFEIKTEGLIRRRKVLRYKGPGKKADEKEKQIYEALQDVSPDVFAAALSIDETTLANLALQDNDERVLEVMVLQMLVRAGRVNILKSHQDKFTGQKFELLAHAMSESLAGLSRERQSEMLAIILQPMSWTSLPSSHVVHGLAGNMISVLPQPVARDLLNSPAWKTVAENLLPQAVEAWAPVIPIELSKQFAEFAEPHSPRATTYHHFLHSLTQQN
jgi:Family of unknown function (DUF5691)